MDDWLTGWGWLNQNAWIASALLVVAFTGGAASMAWHIRATHAHRSNYLAVVGMLILAASFVLVGVSVGEHPIVESRVLIPTGRLLWFTAALVFNASLIAYWSRRIRWKRSAERRETTILSNGHG